MISCDKANAAAFDWVASRNFNICIPELISSKQVSVKDHCLWAGSFKYRFYRWVSLLGRRREILSSDGGGVSLVILCVLVGKHLPTGGFGVCRFGVLCAVRTNLVGYCLSFHTGVEWSTWVLLIGISVYDKFIDLVLRLHWPWELGSRLPTWILWLFCCQMTFR